MAFLGARRVLLAGEGDGRFLAAFLRAYPEAEADYLDARGRMLATARARGGERAGLLVSELWVRRGDGENR